MSNVFKLALVLSAWALCSGHQAYASDDKDQFSIRGVGLISCGLYTDQGEAQGQVNLVVAAWIDGYVTGTNEHQTETYDTLSFESTELLTSVIVDHCKKNPKDNVFAVVKNLLSKLNEQRIIERSPKHEVVVGERTATFYVVVLKRIQRSLADAGFLLKDVDGIFDDATIEAMKKYQHSVGLKPTGFPDQVTVWKLMRS